jgi:hypothetical protein
MFATVGMDNVAALGEQPSWAPVPVHPPLLAVIAGQVPVVVGCPTVQLVALYA